MAKDKTQLLRLIFIDKKIRAGKGKMRGRRYRTKKGILLVTEKKCPMLKSAKNIPGIKAITLKDITTDVFAPGAVPGRLTLWTNKAIEKISKEKSFM